MTKHVSPQESTARSTRRHFLHRAGRSAVASAAAATLWDGHAPAMAARAPGAKPAEGKVGYRLLGRTGLRVSEVGFGGHSWAYARVPDRNGGRRRPSLHEAMQMIAAGLDMGVNFFDACTPTQEHTVPGQVLKRLNKRDQVIISARLCHKQKGVPADKEQIYKFVDQRLKMWQTDYFDLLMLTNTEQDTKMSGYWDMSYSIEALEKVKRQGKIRLTGFGCHFTPALFRKAIAEFGDCFDVCSLPYNVRHRVAEQIMPVAKKAGLGIVTIKPFARGALLENRDLEGADAGLARDMMAFVLENDLVDVCICGVHTIAHVRENFSASWAKLSPGGRERLKRLAAGTPCRDAAWLEQGWLYA